MRLMTFLLISGAWLQPVSLYAQDQRSQGLAGQGGNIGHGDHDGEKADIIVTAPYTRDQSDILSGSSVLAAQELVRDMRPTIGETLSHQPGVSSTSFGPNASRPVLRGFQGERVRVLSDGIGSFDVSNTSADHAVVINPLTADRIEVLRGPAALLFGSSAIGGVVNVIDSRIPRSVPKEAVHIDATATYASAAEERSLGARVDLPLSEHIVLHADGSYTKTGDLDTGGTILAPALRATAAASADPAIADLANLRGTLPNSAARTWEVAGGAAYIGSGGNFGFAVSHHENLYGVPVRYSLDPAVAAESVRLDVNQTRVDGRGEINLSSGVLESIKLRAGYADYQHAELDETGAVGTRFLSDGWEGRLELVQRERDGWRGASGIQMMARKVSIVGAEKFLPRNDTNQFGLFTLQSLDLGQVRIEAGARIEHSIAKAAADVDLGNPDLRSSFTSVSGSLGGSIELVPGWRIGLNAAHTERAPSADELFANGPHAGTQAYEIGSPAFTKEKSDGLELTLHGKGEGYSFTASLYHNWFAGFIYERPTGVVIDDLPVFQFTQAKARYFGAEFEASAKLASLGAVDISLDALGDFTRATIVGGGPVPRIPALRLLGGVEAESPLVDGRLELEWVDGQGRVAAFETPTKGYTMVNASLNLRPFGAESAVSFALSANNIFDVEARRHASVLKDYAPLPGRDLRVTMKWKM